MRNFSNRSIRGLAAASVLGLSLAAVAQQPAKPALSGQAKADAVEQATLLRDFVHYIKINKPDLAAGVGTKLLSKGLSPTQFVDLVEQSGELGRFEDSIGRGMRAPELEGTAAKLLKLYEQGKLDRVRNPEEITKNIKLLGGRERERLWAHERLVAAGEYAMPQLLAGLLQQNDKFLQAEVQGLLIDMSQQSVMPLCTALGQLEPAAQEQVVNILGLIGHRTAAPFLADVNASSKSPNVKQACERAIARIGNPGLGVDPADLYTQLGESYYAEKPELTSFPGEPQQLLWAYNPAIGLTMTDIKTEVFHEAMAMRMCKRSIALRGENNDAAVSLWLASNFSREIQTPAEYDNPAYPKTERDAMYYAVSAGAERCQMVLARGLDTRNTPLARRAIAAIEQTAGGQALRNEGAGDNGRRPLVEALRYPNRRVQYEAALALGRSQPLRSFAGSERVVPLLASAIRDSSLRIAVVISANKEIGDAHRKTLEKAGYRVLPVSAGLSDLAEAIAEAPGIDLIVAEFNNNSDDAANGLIAEAHGNAKLGATPILALVNAPNNIELARRYERDPMVAIRARGISQTMLESAAAQLVDAASGGVIKPEEARDYAVRSVAVLRDLAVSGNTTLDVSEAALPLCSALRDAKGAAKLDIAEVLSRVQQKRVQVALADEALAAAGEERVALLGKVADSAKRYGNQLEARQVQRVVELAAKGDAKEATAAAALVGSLNLTNNMPSLILNSKT